MRSHIQTRSVSRLLIPLVLLLGLIGPARADNLDKAAASLAWVPADAAGYSAMLRAGEQWEAITKSKAWAKLTELPAVKDAWKAMQGPGSPLAALQDKQAQEVLALLGQMVSREVCIVTGDSFADFIVLMQQMQGTAQFGRVGGVLQGKDQAQASIQGLVQALNESRDKIKVPDLLLGFRMENAGKAKDARKRFDGWLADLVENVAAFKGRLKKEKVGEEEWTTLELDGSMVPWNKIPWKDIENEEGEYQPLVKRLKGLKLTVAVGTRGDFVLVSLGSGTAMAQGLGKGKLLAELPELKPLAKFADRKIDSIGYTSKSMATKMGTSKEDIDNMVEVFGAMLEQVPFLDKGDHKRIRKDLKELAKDWKAALPVPGASLSFSFDTERGSESYSHDWTRYPGSGEPKPLTLLQHVGGNPLAAFVTRNHTEAEDYRTLVKWIKVADSYIDDLVLPKLEDEQTKQVEVILKMVRPMFKQLDQITQKSWLPAVKDGQSAFVLDARLTSKQWIAALPPTKKPLPLLEPAIVLGVSDAELLQKAMGDYRSAVNKALKDAQKLGIPPFQIPPAKQTKTDDGVLYTHDIAEALGLDEQLRLSAGVGPKVAVFGISTKMTERLLKATPLKAHGPLAQADRPLLSATYVNCEGFIKALTPWSEMVTDLLLDRNLDEDDKEQRASIRKQVRTVMEVLTVFRSVASVTYVEDRAQVTHTESIIRDLEK